MFEKVHVPILGVVENMSYFHCPHCGERSEIFGTGGARQEAESRGIPFLGEVPLHAEIRQRSDEGFPVAADNGPLGAAFTGVAQSMIGGLEGAGKPAPKISVS